MLQVKDLTIRYGEVAALDGLSLDVGTGEVLSVLGPSGSGKTTLLRSVAGLVRPAAGSIMWDGRELASVPPHRRGFGLMFQDYALFPHMSVDGNVAFGLRMQSLEQGEIGSRVDEALTRVGLAGYGDRSVGSLSGGQQQRVALARAIAPRPSLLMFDEPLGSLDTGLRDQLMQEITAVLRGLQMTALYVTHNQEEAFAVGDRVLLLNEGSAVQVGTPMELWSRPATVFAARFLGFKNLATVPQARERGWPVPPGTGSGHVVYRPDGFAPDPDADIAGTVTARSYRGDHFRVTLEVQGGDAFDIVVRWHPVPEVGDALRLRVDDDAMFVIDD